MDCAYRHMHEDEEIRYILEDSGFFDVRGSWFQLSFGKVVFIVYF